MSREKNNFGNVLAALADSNRRQLLNDIAERGQATATALAATATISRQAVVKHLAVLNEAGLVTGKRIGREVRYSVCPRQLSETAEWMAHLADDWDRRLAWVKYLAEDKETTE